MLNTDSIPGRVMNVRGYISRWTSSSKVSATELDNEAGCKGDDSHDASDDQYQAPIGEARIAAKGALESRLSFFLHQCGRAGNFALVSESIDFKAPNHAAMG